jgi:hypothetical protein
MILVVFLALFVMVAAVVLAVVVTGAVVGASMGAALGGTLPWVFHRPAIGKGGHTPDVFGQVLRGTLGIVGGGLLGGLSGIGVAVLVLWALVAFG